VIFIDSNVFFYSMISDVKYGAACSTILKDVAEGRIKAVTSSLVLAEVVNALHKYGLRELVRRSVDAVCSLPITISAVDSLVIRDAVSVFEEVEISPYDCVHLAMMKRLGVNKILSADSDFDRVKWVKRIEPLKYQREKTSFERR
jgi:predicted nucleic acid-binding protein